MCRAFFALAFALVAVVNSGCVLEPINGGQIRNETTRFYGFFPEPDSEILVQALNPDTVEWETIARTRSSKTGVRTGFAPFPGSDSFYYWDAGDVVVPEHLWDINELNLWYRKRCVLRAVTIGGQILPSYNERPDVFADPVQEWLEKGNKQELVITLYDLFD